MRLLSVQCLMCRWAFSRPLSEYDGVVTLDRTRTIPSAAPSGYLLMRGGV